MLIEGGSGVLIFKWMEMVERGAGLLVVNPQTDVNVTIIRPISSPLNSLKPPSSPIPAHLSPPQRPQRIVIRPLLQLNPRTILPHPLHHWIVILRNGQHLVSLVKIMLQGYYPTPAKYQRKSIGVNTQYYYSNRA